MPLLGPTIKTPHNLKYIPNAQSSNILKHFGIHFLWWFEWRMSSKVSRIWTVWSPVLGAVWEVAGPVGGRALQDEAYHWGWASRVYSFTHFLFFLFPVCSWDVICQPLLPCCAFPYHGVSLSLWNGKSKYAFLPNVSLIVEFYHDDRKVLIQFSTHEFWGNSRRIPLRVWKWDIQR